MATGEVKKMTSLVNIFDREAFEKELEQLEGKSAGSKADTIAHRTKRTINERMDDDPAFYAKFSKMLEDAIVAFQQKRFADIVKTHRIANWTNNPDVQNQMQTAIEDYLHELEGTGLDLSFDEIDMILEKCLDIARRRYA